MYSAKVYDTAKLEPKDAKDVTVAFLKKNVVDLFKALHSGQRQDVMVASQQLQNIDKYRLENGWWLQYELTDYHRNEWDWCKVCEASEIDIKLYDFINAVDNIEKPQ